MEFLVAVTRTAITPHAARELGAVGVLKRMWRTPTGVMALFCAEDPDDLTDVLEPDSAVSALGAHPDDPLLSKTVSRPGVGPEYLITMTVTVPAEITTTAFDDVARRQARRDQDLAARGNLVRLWALADEGEGPRRIGLCRARDPGDLLAVLDSLPMAEWMTFETIPLAPHPDDPVRFA